MSHYKFCLSDDYSFATGRHLSNSVTFRDRTNVPRLHISHDGVITVYRRYAWDGCSPKCRVFDWFYLGTTDGTLNRVTGQPKTYFASLVHDALYQFMDHPDMPFSRKEMDDIFLVLMHQSGFSLRWPYYVAVRVLGGMYRRIARALQFP